MHVLSIRICPRDQRAYLISTILDNRCPRPVCSPWYKIIARDDHRDQGRCPCHPWNLHFAIHFLIVQRVQCVKDNIQIEIMSLWDEHLFKDHRYLKISVRDSQSSCGNNASTALAQDTLCARSWPQHIWNIPKQSRPAGNPFVTHPKYPKTIATKQNDRLETH